MSKIGCSTMASDPAARTRCWGVLLIAAIVGLGATANAQPDVAASPGDTVWTHRVVGGLNLTQVALKDWAGGGEDAIAWTVNITGRSDYQRDQVDWSSEYSFAFGQTKLGDAGVRKTDDKIDLSTTATYLLGVYVNPYVSATLKSQFARGYNYTDAGKVGVSQFFDPAYLTQTAGVGYQPAPQVKTRAGVGLREIVTRDYTSYSDDASTAKIEKLQVDAGLESVTQVEWALAQNMLLTSKLEVFAPLAALDETAVRSDSSLNLKVNRFVSTNLSLQIVDDPSAHDKMQIKEALSLGLTYTFL